MLYNLSMTPKETFDILKRNIITPVVISLYALSALLIVVREFKDAYFVSVVITLNTTFAIIQEIRARRALKKLELLNAPFARLVMPDGTVRHIPFNEVTVGQHLELVPGDDIPADGTISESRGLEVNESLLTGESAAVIKHPTDSVYASSSVTAGTAAFTVTATGASTRAGIITNQLRAYVPELTPLQKTINQLITGLTFFALALSGLIVLTYSIYDYAPNVIVKTITSAGTVIIPEGLLLGSTVLLAYGSIKLARAKVLPQKLSAIEAMALLNVLCVDKTGTLTSEKIMLDQVIPLGNAYTKEQLMELAGTAASAADSGNSTSAAMIASLPSHPEVQPLSVLAFTSQRKLSGVRYKVGAATYTLFMGAPEFVSHYAPLTSKDKSLISELAGQGLRVILLAEFADDTTPLENLPHGAAKPIGLITLRNGLRDGVQKTISFLQDRGVSVRVISGDNPDTVAYIARAAGISNTQHVITGTQLNTLSPKKWDKTVLATTIFARVLPEQKERIIDTFKQHGHFTGMVGDGVNDALALKKADLGVAMFSGASATRRVADIILLNDSFNSLPIGMRLGNRIMLAIEVIAILFFHKIIYGVFTLLATMIAIHPYPFAPRHNTFMNVFMVTLPTIILTLFPPRARQNINPRLFWRNTLLPTIPMAVVSGIAVTLTYLYTIDSLKLSYMAAGTISVVVATILGANMVFQAPRMLGVVATHTLRLARILYICIALVVASASFGFTISRDFFDFARPTLSQFVHTWPIALVIISAVTIQYVWAGIVKKRLLDKS